MQEDVAGKKAPALWPSHLGIVGGRCLCLESSDLAAFLLGGMLVLRSLKALREAWSPFHLLWCWLLPPASRAASASVAGVEGRQLSWPAWREGTPPVLSQLCSGEGPVVPLACPGGQLPCSRIAGIPAEQALLSVADPHTAPFSCWPRSAASLPSSHQGGKQHRSGDLSQARARPLPQGIAHRISQPPAVSRPVCCSAFLSPLPLLGGGEGHTPASSPPAGSAAPPCPLSLSPYRPLLAAGPLPYKVWCRVPACVSTGNSPFWREAFPMELRGLCPCCWGRQAR